MTYQFPSIRHWLGLTLSVLDTACEEGDQQTAASSEKGNLSSPSLRVAFVPFLSIHILGALALIVSFNDVSCLFILMVLSFEILSFNVVTQRLLIVFSFKYCLSKV